MKVRIKILKITKRLHSNRRTGFGTVNIYVNIWTNILIVSSSSQNKAF
jgi:hypothetical protein